MGNVNSLANKTDKLAALVRNQKLYRECSLMCLTEMWLTSCIPTANVELPGFSVVRLDRDNKLSGKKKGGGLVLYINKRWCNPSHVTVNETVCSKDVELLAVILQLNYMPRAFSHAIVICVYVPSQALPDTACDVIHSTIPRLQTLHTDAFFALITLHWAPPPLIFTSLLNAQRGKTGQQDSFISRQCTSQKYRGYRLLLAPSESGHLKQKRP